MTDLWTKLKQRKLVQWAMAYVAFAFALLQGIDIVAQRFDWPVGIERGLIVALVVGFFAALVIAWYHGERGEQRVTSMEILVLAVLLALGGGFLWQFTRSPPEHSPQGVIAAAATSYRAPAASRTVVQAHPSRADIPAKSIAVLPFENLSEDKGNQYFAAGMQDLILTKLAGIGDLKVISRTSTLSYGSHPQNLKVVGQQLGVATLLEGSVQKAGDQVLINVQLIDVASDSHLWAESYTRTLKNVFGVEGEVSEQIAQALKARLSPAETKRLNTALSNNPAANDLYLRAEYFAHQGDINFYTASFKQAIPLYKQAITKVPDFALAWARLSISESSLAEFGGGGEAVQQLTTEARRQAERALALAPDLAAAHLAIGLSDYHGQSDYTGALSAFAAALKLRPNDAEALAARGYVLRRQGHFEAAIAAFQQALAHDPRNSLRAFDLGATYMLESRYPEAEAAFQHALALDPDNLNAKVQYSQALLLASGDVARALDAAQGGAAPLQLQRVSLLTYQRKYKAALALLAVIPDTPDNFAFYDGSKAQGQAALYRLAGDDARARTLYERALPFARAQVKVQAGSAINESGVWGTVADAELGLGHTTAGIAAIAKSQTLMTRAHDHFIGPAVTERNAGRYAEAHRPDLAVPLLEKALATPGIGDWYSPALLWLDPAWDPIRRDPRFQALLKAYADAAPPSATAPAATIALGSGR